MFLDSAHPPVVIYDCSDTKGCLLGLFFDFITLLILDTLLPRTDSLLFLCLNLSAMWWPENLCVVWWVSQQKASTEVATVDTECQAHEARTNIGGRSWARVKSSASQYWFFFTVLCWTVLSMFPKTFSFHRLQQKWRADFVSLIPNIIIAEKRRQW